MPPFPVELQGKPYIALSHHLEKGILLELEPAEDCSLESLTRLNAFLTATFEQLSRTETFLEASALMADKIGQLLAYDRVMIYQFDEDWHGHVIAEKVKKGVHSYLNHHFPASDIPLQAREMLAKKGIRQIVDVGAESVPLVPYLHPLTGKPIDVSNAELRNPSEIHLQYLKNMQVGASISIAIMVKGTLWGLVCCHHRSPLFIDYYKRNIALLLTQYYASTILSAKQQGDKQLQQRYNWVEKVLVEQMEENLNIREGLFSKAITLLDLCSATGVALLLEGKLTTLGDCPSGEAIRELIGWVNGQEFPPLYYTRELHKVYPPAFAYKQIGSGLMLLELSRHNKEYLLFFKPEIEHTISWAGNPNKPLQIDVRQKLHPRKSFAKWEQAIEGKSSPWTDLEVEHARSLIKNLVSIQLKCQGERLGKLNGQLKKALGQLEAKNEQLEDFTRIASHNLLAPLNNIRGLLSLYHTNTDFATAQLVLDKIYVVSSHMRQTLEELHELLKVNESKELTLEVLDLEGLINRERQSLSDQIRQTGAQIQTHLQVLSIRYPRVYMESILHNLLSNALKYRATRRTPLIWINSWQEGEKLLLEVQDNGIGIDLEKHGDKLFGLYKTFHEHADSRGIGLYLVKKQVESLGGNIEVESKVDQGTRFKVQLPRMGQEGPKQSLDPKEGEAQKRLA